MSHYPTAKRKTASNRVLLEKLLIVAHLLWNSTVHYLIHMRLAPVNILNHMNPDEAFTF
jgi:hypothetical protein